MRDNDDQFRERHFQVKNFNSNDKLCSDNTKEQKDLEAVPFPTLPIHGPSGEDDEN